jgi:hypothetical protein
MLIVSPELTTNPLPGLLPPLGIVGRVKVNVYEPPLLRVKLVPEDPITKQRLDPSVAPQVAEVLSLRNLMTCGFVQFAILQLLSWVGIEVALTLPPVTARMRVSDLLKPVLELIPLIVIDATLTATAPTFLTKIVMFPCGIEVAVIVPLLVPVAASIAIED